MNEIKRALRPVKRRLRLLRLWRAASLSVLSGSLIALCIMVCAFFTPIRCKLELAGLALAAAILAGCAVSLLRPVRDSFAARAADRHGLKERAQTALVLCGDSPMEQLQRCDAFNALRQFDCKAIRFPDMRRPLLAAAVIIALCVVTLALPNPQNAVIERTLAFEQQMNEAAERAETEAAKADSELSEKDMQELRRLLSDLSRELRESSDAMEAMLAISKAEERLEALRDRMAGDAMNQLAQNLSAQGMEALAEALENGDMHALEDALATADAEALESAANQLSGELQNLLSAAAQSMQNGNPSAALHSLSQLQNAAQSCAASQLSSASQLLSSLRTAGMSGQSQGGQGTGQGQNGQSGNGAGGSGAGEGSTNQDQGGFNEENGGRSGNADPHYREGEYESIYDPTRLDASQTDLSAQSTKSEGESSQVQLGPGAGAIGDSVPYNQVVLEYAEAAAQAADSRNLTAEERGWVNDYFSSLTE